MREIALRREPASLVFPPLLTLADVQKSLPDKHAALAFFATGRRMYGFLLDNEQCKCWQIGVQPQALVGQIQALLREMGQFGPNHEMAVKELGRREVEAGRPGKSSTRC